MKKPAPQFILLVLIFFSCQSITQNEISEQNARYQDLKNGAINHLDSIKKIINQDTATAQKLGLSNSELQMLRSIVATLSGKYSQAISLLEPIATPAKLSSLSLALQADVHNYLGICYTNTNKVRLGLQNYQKSLRIGEDLNDTNIQARALNNIASELTIANNPDESIVYLKRCIELTTAARLHRLTNDAYTNLSYAWEKKGNFDSAIACILTVLHNEDYVGNPLYNITTYDQLGYLYTEANKLDSALFYLEKAKAIADSSKNLTNFYWVYATLANYYTNVGDYNAALKFADTVYSQASANQYHQGRLDIYNTYTEIYRLTGNYKLAYMYSDAAYLLSDSLFRQNQQEDLSALQKSYELTVASNQLLQERQNLYYNRLLSMLLAFALCVAIVLIMWRVWVARKQKKLIKVIDFERLKTEEALQENKKLIAFIAHEIRNPLTGIIGISKMLLNDRINPEQKEFLTYQLNAGNNLLQLLSQLLDYQKVQSGKQELQLIPCSIKDVLKQVYEMYASLIQQKGITYKLQFDKSIPESLHADPVKLTQVFGNLVNNAIKFCKTNQGEVTVTLTLIHSNSTLATILCSVRDNGAGISDADKEKIFDLYVQSSKNKSQQLGTGIGLSLVKHYLELMKSKIEIESTEGRGTTFSFTITLAK